MPVKYQCPKCSRRFADWGAQKLGFKCPHDELCPPGAAGEEITLTKMGGGSGDDLIVAPTLRRRPKKEVIGVSSFDEETPTDTEDLEREDLDAEDNEDDDFDEEEDDVEAVEADAIIEPDVLVEDVDDVDDEEIAGDDIEFEGDATEDLEEEP